MFAVPVLVVSQDGTFDFFDGSLLKLDPNLGGTSKLAVYSKIRKNGWFNIDFGCKGYARVLPDGRVFVFIGLAPIGSKVDKRVTVPQVFSEDGFEDFVAGLMDRENHYKLQAEEDLNLLVHDLRRLSNSIYQAALMAKNMVAEKKYGMISTILDNVIASQSMLTLRTDVLDFSGNMSAGQSRESIPVYKKVDKVIRSFRPSAERRNIQLLIEGESHGRIFGPNAFEIVPYVIIDNAIKYSPDHSHVKAKVIEIDDCVDLSFYSLGPDIVPADRDKIFQKGYRSHAAKQRDPSGSGAGLFLAKNLVEQFGGRTWVEVVGSPVDTSKGECREIIFRVRIPLETS